MVNMKDIARLAGVSHGTVSNVINKKGNVSIDKIHLVEEAAAQLGYNLNAQAQQLRKEHLQQVAIILPNVLLDGYHDFYTTLNRLLTSEGYNTELLLTDSIPTKEKECIQDALQGRPEYIVAISSLAEAAEFYDVNTQVILVNQPQVKPLRQQYVFSFDYKSAVDAIVTKLRELKHDTVAVFADPVNTPADRFFIDTLNISNTSKDIKFTVFSYDTRLAHNGAVDILSSEPGFDAILTLDPHRAEILGDAKTLIDKSCPTIITLASKRVMPSYEPVKFEMDFSLLARRVFERITTESILDNPVQLVPVYGFSQLNIQKHIKQRGEITLATLTSPSSDVLQVLAPHFYNCTGIKLKIIALPYNELFDMTSSYSLPFDLIRMDIAWKSVLQKKLCRSLNGFEPQLADIKKSILPSIYSAYIKPGDENNLLPFDPSIQLLFYRKDLFEDVKIRRMYYESYHQQLEVPRSFKEYNQLAAFFTRKINPSSPTQYGTTMTFGSAMVAACDFLPRMRNQGKEFFDPTGRIKVNTPEIVDILRTYTDLKDYSCPDVHFWWNDSMESFANGSTAMTIVFANHASKIINSRNSVVFDKVGTAMIPGGSPLLGGGCIGISNQSNNIDFCLEFLHWVYSDSIANLIALLGGHSPVASVYSNEEILSLYPWFRDISQHFQVGSRITLHPEYTNFDSFRFEQILGLAVRSASMGVMSHEDALEFAQNQYEKEYGFRE